MSTDFDLTPVTADDSAQAPARPAPTFVAVPVSTPTPAQTRTAPVKDEDEPAGSLTAFLVTGGPAVAIIFGCYLLHAFGPWLLLGALLMAAVAAAAVVKLAAARARRGRSNGRARTNTSRGSPSGRSSGSGGGGRGTRRTGAGGGSGSGSGGGRRGGGLLSRGSRAGGMSAGSASGGAGARKQRRNTLLAGAGRRKGAGGLGKGKATGGARKPGSLSPRGLSTGKGTGASGSGTSSSVNRRTPSPLRRSPGTSAKHNQGRASLLRRMLGKTMPGGTKHTKKNTKPTATTKAQHGKKSGNKAGKKGAGAKTTGPASTTAPIQKSTGSKAVAAARRAAAAASRGKKRVVSARTGTHPRMKAATSPKRKAYTRGPSTAGQQYGKPTARWKRRMVRAATSRKARALRTTSRKVWRNARKAGKAGNAFFSPLIARAYMRIGRRIGWAQRHMNRIAHTATGPNWGPKMAGVLATSLGKVMNAGMWVAKRRHVQAWLLKHYASTGLGNPALAAAKAAATLKPVSLAKTPKANVQPAQPGPVVRILTPTRSAAQTVRNPIGGPTVAASPDDIADAFDQWIAQFEPEDVLDLQSHFQSFGPMLERFAASTARHAQRLQDEYELKGPVVEMIEQFGSAFAGMTDLAEDVVGSWRAEHEPDIERHEDPRATEWTFWSKPSDGSA